MDDQTAVQEPDQQAGGEIPTTLKWADNPQETIAPPKSLKWADEPEAPKSLQWSDTWQAAQPKPQGFWESVGHTFGIGKEEAEARKQNLEQHPVRTILEDQPPVRAAMGLYQGAKRIGGELQQAYEAGKEGNTPAVAQHAIQATPFIGAGIKRGAEQLTPQLGVQDPFNAGTLGTIAGTAPQAALAVTGGWEGLKAARAAKLRGAAPAASSAVPSVPANTTNIDNIEALDSLARAGRDAQPTAPPPVPEQAAPSPAPAPLPENLQAAQDALTGKPLRPLPTAESIAAGLREPAPQPGVEIHAGPKPVPEQVAPQAGPQAAPQSETPLLDALVERMQSEVKGKTPDEISALRDAVDETGRRAHAAGDMRTAEQAADEHTALSKLLEDAVANTESKRPVVQGSTNPERIQQSAQEQKPAMQQAAAAAVAGIPGAKVEGVRVKDAESVDNKDERGKAPETITDHLGGRVSAPTPEAVAQVKQNIEQNLPVVGKDQIDNNGLKATQYAVQTGKPGEANQQSELQVVTTDQAKAMKETDPLYDKQKEALARGDQKEAERIGAQIKEKFDAAQSLSARGPAATTEAVNRQLAKNGTPNTRTPEEQRQLSEQDVKNQPEQAAKNLHYLSTISPESAQQAKRTLENASDAVRAAYTALIGSQHGNDTGAASDHVQGVQPQGSKGLPESDRPAREGGSGTSSSKPSAPAASQGGAASPTAGTGGAGANQPASVEPTKGTRIQLKDGRNGTVEWWDRTKKQARIRRDDGKMMPVVPRDAFTTLASNQGEKDEVTPEAKGDKWIGVDLDGTLAQYDGFKGKTVIGEPIPAMVARVKQWIADGNNVKILTARVNEDKDGTTRKTIQDWTEKHIGKRLEVTDVKDHKMVALYDDRAVSVERNTGALLAQPQAEEHAKSGNGGGPSAAATPKGEGGETNAIREQGPKGLLQRQPEEDRGGNRGRVQPEQQGNGPAGESAKPAGEKEAKPLGGENGEQGQKANAADEVEKPITAREFQTGMRVRVDKIPPGSYLTAGITYTVTVQDKGRGIDFRRENGSGTQESTRTAQGGEYTLIAMPKTWKGHVKAKKAKADTIPSVTPSQGAGDKSTQPKQETPAGASPNAAPDLVEWFGASKVVNENGGPQVVYHGTRGTFDRFGNSKRDWRGAVIPGEREASASFWFTDNYQNAQEFANQGVSTPRGVFYGSGKVKEVYLKLVNPLIVDMREQQLTPEEKKWSFPEGIEIGFRKERVIRQAKKDGRDGVIFLNALDGNFRAGKIYAVFDADQIRDPKSESFPAPAKSAEPVAPAFSPGQRVTISGEGFQDARGNGIADDEGTVKKFTPAADNHGFNTAVIVRPDGNETRISWAEGKDAPIRPFGEANPKPEPKKPAVGTPEEKAKVRGELAELERRREEVRQQYEKVGYYSEGGKDLSNQNVELTKQIFVKEDELAKLNGEPTRDERKAMQEQAATTPFDQRPAQAMKYDQPQQSQHWQVMEPDYANRRFESQVAQYERAVKSDAAEVENAKAGTKAYDKAKASLDWRRAILKRLKDRDDKIAQQYKHEYLDLVKKAISKGSPVPDSVIAQYSEFRTALDARERYEKGRHTSFANRSAAINDTMQKEEGFKAKRQDGKAITDAQVKEIKDGIEDIASVLGADLRDMMRGTDLTIAHTNGKHPFLSDAGGMYHPGEKSISAGINNWLGQPVRALAHEVGHWFDYESGKVMGAETKIMRGGKRVATAYASEADADKARYAGYGARAESLYSQALKTMTDTLEVVRMLKVTKLSDLKPETRSEVERTKVVLGHYWREPREIFARLFEQYISEKLGRGGLASETPELYHTTPGWWDKDAWAKLQPMVEAEVNKRLAAMRERYAPKAPEVGNENAKANPTTVSENPESGAQGRIDQETAGAVEPKPAAKPKNWAGTVKAKKEAPAALRTITGQDGKGTTLLTPSRELPATYRLVEADDLQPSHNAHTFAKNPTYPEGLQERAYDTSKEAQNRVIQQAQNYDPRYTVNTNPDAVNGPPVITPAGIVLGGNSRAMSTQRLYATRGDTYRAALKETAATYGFTPEQVDAMKKPVLVRQVENPSTPDDARRLGSELNKSMTGAMGVAERAVSAGKNIKADTLRNVAAMMQADDSTLREAMGKHGSEIVKMLTADGVITERERPQFVDTATGGLSEEGKAFVERALMGTVIDDPRLMDAAPKSVLQKLERSLGSITSFASRADEWNLLPAIREAVAELGAIQSSGGTVDLRLGQTSLFGGERNPLVDAIIRALDGKPTAIRRAFDDYARDADQNLPGQARMFGEANAFDAFNASFGSTLTEQEYYDGLEAAATKAPDAAADASAPGDGGLFEGTEGNAPRSGGTGEASGKLTPPPSDLNTLYTGFLDPALFKRLFPDVTERTALWASDTVTPADDQRAMMRETRGQMDRRVAIAIFKLRDAAKEWRTRPRAESIDFWNAVENGRIATLSPKDQALAQVFKAAFDQMKGDIQKLKPEALQNYIENYFPHIWEGSAGVRKAITGVLTGKKPLAGKGGFLKRRTIPTMQDGLDMGFTPKSWNPVDLFVLKYAEMAQFLMGHQTLEVMKESGTAKFVRLGQKAPDGWTQLDDKISTVHRRVKVLDDDKLDDVTQDLTYPGGKRKIPGAFSEDIEDSTHGELALVGHYYAPADAAKIFNRFVSRGIAGRSSVYDTLRWLNDNLNGLQLGISAFHATVTTVNAAASDIALGIEQLMQGKPVKAGASMVSGAAILPTLFRTIRNGSKLMREYLSPGSHAKMAKEANAIAEAGGRVTENSIELSPFDKAINAFRNGAFLEGLSAVPGAILHGLTYPVLGYYVPKMKVGAFYYMAHNILDEAERKNWTPEIIRTRMQEAWDSIDDRFGQVVYDNLFWHKGLRDALHLVVRAVGYTYGDIRTYGGAAIDTAKAAVQIAEGKKPRVTPRMAFAVGSFLSTALLGGVMTLAWTGHAPQTWKDYTHPRDTAGQRHTIPGYPDQMISAAHDPVQWVLNKQAPIWTAFGEMGRNQDYDRTEIRHKDDPAVQQLAEVAAWTGRQAVPFSFTNTAKLLEKRGALPSLESMLHEAEKHPGDLALGQLGFQSAPAFIQNSAALNKAREYVRENAPAGTKTKEQADKTRAMHAVEDMYRTGEVDQATIQELRREHVISQADTLKARLHAKQDPLVRLTKSLSPDQALHVWNLADEKERRELRPTIELKSREIQSKISDPAKRNDLHRQYREALNGKPVQLRPGSV